MAATVNVVIVKQQNYQYEMTKHLKKNNFFKKMCIQICDFERCFLGMSLGKVFE